MTVTRSSSFLSATQWRVLPAPFATMLLMSLACVPAPPADPSERTLTIASTSTVQAPTASNTSEGVGEDSPAAGRPEPAANPSLDQTAAVGWIGISMKQTDDGVFVAGVLRNSPAALAGLESGDRLLRINGQTVNTPAEVGSRVQALAPGSRVTFDVRRSDAIRLFHGTIEAKPDRELLIRRELIGQPAPTISELRTVQGAVVPSWSQLRGHVVLLEFWASWCVACRALAPTLNDWHDEFSAMGVHILGVTMDPYEEAVRASEHLTFPTFSDEEGHVTMRYQGTAVPTLVLVDKQGVVVDVMVGLDFEQLPLFKQRVAALTRATP